MIQCVMCPNEADIYWDPVSIIGITPAGRELAAFLAQAEHVRIHVCVACYIDQGGKLSAAIEPEQKRRAEDPS